MSAESTGATTPAHFSEALKRAREIASKLTGKGLPQTSPLGNDPFLILDITNKRPAEGDDGVDEKFSISKRPGPADPAIELAKAALASGQALSSDGAVQVCVAPKALKTTIEFVVPGFKVGLIIGKNGETLKRLERMSDCKITFSPLTASNPADMPERKVFVTGLPDDVGHCKRLVLEKINEGPPMVIAAGATAPPMPPGSVVPVQLPNGVSLQVPIHRDEKGTILPMEHLFIPNNKVGLIIGRGGETIKDIQDRSEARIYIAPDASMTSDFSTERFIAISGTDEGILIAKHMLEDVLEGRTPLLGAGSSAEIGKITVSLVMPDEVVGMVIGKKGEYFKWMMAETRCRITVDPPVSDGGPNREITITGPPEGVAYAQALIHDKVSNSAQLDVSGTTYTLLPTATASYDPSQYYQQYQGITNPQYPALYTQEQLQAVFKYYFDYYVSTGVDDAMAHHAALSAMTAANIPHPMLEKGNELISPNAAPSVRKASKPSEPPAQVEENDNPSVEVHFSASKDEYTGGVENNNTAEHDGLIHTGKLIGNVEDDDQSNASGIGNTPVGANVDIPAGIAN